MPSDNSMQDACHAHVGKLPLQSPEACCVYLEGDRTTTSLDTRVPRATKAAGRGTFVRGLGLNQAMVVRMMEALGPDWLLLSDGELAEALQALKEARLRCETGASCATPGRSRSRVHSVLDATARISLEVAFKNFKELYVRQ